jgi:hypothetical protein
MACGTSEALTFDCIVPQGDSHHRGSTDQRICFYRSEMRLGNVQLLCLSCNCLKADLSQHIFLAAISMARVRLTNRRAAPPPVQGSLSDPQVFRGHLSEVLNLCAGIPEDAPF